MDILTLLDVQFYYIQKQFPIFDIMRDFTIFALEMKKILSILFVILSTIFALGNAFAHNNIKASLITCWPGGEIYELYGHSAIRIQSITGDTIYNFGTFDYDEPAFIWRFIKGETDYYLSAYPFQYFLPAYIDRGSKVIEQELNLTHSQAENLQNRLRQLSKPENARYRYKYLHNNCATKIADNIDEAIGSPVAYSDSIKFHSFRDAMKYYNRNYPWYQFGIDIVLGSELDRNIDNREEMFMPIEFMRKAATAKLPDGTLFVSSTNILASGADTGNILPPTPFGKSPLAISILCLLISICICLYDYKRINTSNIWYAIWFLICGLTGCLIFFLSFFSEHEATNPNINLWWLNPTSLIVPALIWGNRTRPIVAIWCILNLVIDCGIILIWGMQMQCGNAAFIPLILATALLSANFAIIFYRKTSNKDSYIMSSSSKRKRKRPHRRIRK